MTTLTMVLTGQRMIARLTLQGVFTGLSVSETAGAIVLLGWGILLVPGGLDPTTGYREMQQAAPAMVWAAFALLVGGSQIAGVLFTVLGISAPRRWVRLPALLVTAGFFFMLASVQASNGFTTGPLAYGALGCIALADFRRAHLNGHGH